MYIRRFLENFTKKTIQNSGQYSALEMKYRAKRFKYLISLIKKSDAKWT